MNHSQKNSPKVGRGTNTSRGLGKAPSQRQLRVGEELRHVLSRILSRGDLHDPELTGINITVTEVRVSPDLKSATAFVVPLGGETLGPTVAALNRAAGFLRGQIGHEINLRYTPRISFQADHSFDQAMRIQDVLNRPKVRQDLVARELAPEVGSDPDDGSASEDGADQDGA